VFTSLRLPTLPSLRLPRPPTQKCKMGTGLRIVWVLGSRAGGIWKKSVGLFKNALFIKLSIIFFFSVFLFAESALNYKRALLFPSSSSESLTSPNKTQCAKVQKVAYYVPKTTHQRRKTTRRLYTLGGCTVGG